MCNRYILVPVLLLASSVFAQTGDGDLSNGEAWCDLNPVNCICSEPLTATDYLNPSGESSDRTPEDASPDDWNPNDSTSNECGQDRAGFPIRTYDRNAQPSDRISPNNPAPGTVYNNEAYSASALPNRIPQFTPRFRGRPYEDAYTGINWMGHRLDWTPAFSSFKGRRSFRWYYWYPSNFNYTSGGQNSKKWQSQIGDYWTGGPGVMSHKGGTHGWASTTAGKSECGLLHMNSTRGANPANYDAAYFAGSWVRVEVIVDQITDGLGNPGVGNGTRVRWMHKNISKDLPEVTWTDTFNTTTPSPQTNDNPNGPMIDNSAWNCSGVTDLWRAGEDNDHFQMNNYGQASDPSPDIPRWKGWAYVQVAAWTQAEMDAAGFDLYGADKWNTTDFRIGSAYEMEGVAGEIDPGVVRPGDTSPMIAE